MFVFLRTIVVALMTFFSLELVYAEMHNKVSVRAAKVVKFDFYEKYNTVFLVSSEQGRDFFAKVAGTVDAVAVKQGQTVEEGDLLIAINQNMANSIKLAAETALKSARSNYDRDLLLFKKKIISEETLTLSEVALNQSKLELEKAMITYEDMVIKAPASGYIGVVRANVGDVTKVGDYLFSFIVPGAEKNGFAELPEALIGRVNYDSVAKMQDLSGKEYEGKITALSNYVSDKGTITAKMSFAGDMAVPYGSYREVSIIFNQHKAPGVPERAVLRNNQGSFVYQVTDEGVIKQTYVTLGIRTNGMIELLSNELKEGDQIVTEGLTKIYDGSIVKLLD